MGDGSPARHSVFKRPIQEDFWGRFERLGDGTSQLARIQQMYQGKASTYQSTFLMLSISCCASNCACHLGSPLPPCGFQMKIRNSNLQAPSFAASVLDSWGVDERPSH